MQRQKSKKMILGLTGSFGSGKSTVAGMLRACGASVLDADKIAHRCLSRGTVTYKKILSIFGTRILNRNKKIDRKRLAAVVFGNKALLKILNKIIHPQVISIIKEKLRRCDKKIIVIDAPLLIEAGLRRIADKLIVVKTSRPQQIKRIQKRMRLGREEISKRIKAQIPLQCKVRLADFVIDNNGTRKQTQRQVKEIWKKTEGMWKS